MQTTAKLVLEPIFEAKLEPAAFGYRPNRSANQAIQTVLGLLRQGCTDAVDADLSRYFDTIPHQALMQSIARRVVNPDTNSNKTACPTKTRPPHYAPAVRRCSRSIASIMN